MVLIVGCGFLGQYVLGEILSRAEEKIIATYNQNTIGPFADSGRVARVRLDVTDEGDIASLKNAVGDEELTVFYFASMHNVDRVFEYPADAHRINVGALGRFLEVFGGNIRQLVYSSTDCVYGEGEGRDAPFRETDETKPISVYGMQKKEAEQLVLSAGFRVARLPYMAGPSLSERKHFYDRIADDLAHSRPVYMAQGLERSVLSYAQAANVLVSLAFAPDAPPVVNVAGDRGYTKYEMGLRIARHLGRPEELVRKMSAEETKKLFKDARAEKAVMDNSLLKSVLNIDRLEWELT